VAPVLETKALARHFGGLKALDGVDLAVEEAEIFGLIGPNGSGKTTTLNVISGFLPATAGSTSYRGATITGLKPFQIARRGLVRTFQLTSVFGNLTVLENLVHASHLRTRSTLLGCLLHSPGYRREEERLRAGAAEVLAFVGLPPQRHGVKARNLSAGEQRYLELAIALAADPDILLLDEPATGLNHEEAERVVSLIRSIRDRGTTVVLVEHNMRVIMSICSRIAVLNLGRKIAEGTPQEIAADEGVVAAYLGRRRGA
jgi:branched-chain amino acid transport system ATP-binding protein